MNQRDFISKLSVDFPDSVIVGSLGTISSDLGGTNHAKKILVKGAMGHAIAIGLGYAIGSPKEDVIVLIGDGSYLMKAGSASTVLANGLTNLRVIVLNNGCYASCGGQKTNFPAMRKFVPFEVVDVTS